MQELEKAIKIAGGVGALASAIGVRNPNAISMWRKRGRVPAPWAILLRMFIERHSAAEPA